jgi:H3 lysine-79-specific histone-lysine N-methyltransferase
MPITSRYHASRDKQELLLALLWPIVAGKDNGATVVKTNGTKEDTYGELMFSGVEKMLDFAGLQDNKAFVDLGSGIGNVVIHTALWYRLSKCTGLELNKECDAAAKVYYKPTKAHAHLWNAALGQVHLRRLNICNFHIKDERPDVVFVNNKVFGPGCELMMWPR